MKKTFSVILTAFMIILISGCSKKSDSTPAVFTGTGSWQMTNMYEASTNIQGGNVSTDPSNLTINSDGTYSSSDFNYTLVGTSDAVAADHGTWTYSSNALKITSSNSNKTINCQILKVTASDLWFRYQVYWGDYYELHFVK